MSTFICTDELSDSLRVYQLACIFYVVTETTLAFNC